MTPPSAYKNHNNIWLPVLCSRHLFVSPTSYQLFLYKLGRQEKVPSTTMGPFQPRTASPASTPGLCCRHYCCSDLTPFLLDSFIFNDDLFALCTDCPVLLINTLVADAMLAGVCWSPPRSTRLSLPSQCLRLESPSSIMSLLSPLCTVEHHGGSHCTAVAHQILVT